MSFTFITNQYLPMQLVFVAYHHNQGTNRSKTKVGQTLHQNYQVKGQNCAQHYCKKRDKVKKKQDPQEILNQ